MIRNLTLVVSLDNPETLSAILKLLEPFQEEISVSVRDNDNGPMMAAHIGHIGHISHTEVLEMALSRESERGIILVCGGNYPPRRDEMAEIFTDKLKELNQSLNISKERIVIEEKNKQQEIFFNKQPQKHWRPKQVNNYKSKVTKKFIPRTKKR
jgi:hypothetical protein